tara:strand:+ start:74 stop:418 length:345 start_codon:yes stop_codon:yes gene_type:complete
MKKLLLILALFVVGCSNLNITNLECDLESSTNDFNVKDLQNVVSVRLDENKMKIRFGLVPVQTIFQDDFLLKSIFSYQYQKWEIRINEYLEMYITRTNEAGPGQERHSYICKVI